jgi:DegV family protein with EDD domain
MQILTSGGKMSKVALVTDSTAYIPKNLVEEYHISVAPQVLIWGQETFRDGVDITPDEFYTRLKKATVMPSTSQVNIASFQQIFQGLLEDDHEILAILVSNRLSKTVDSALQACEIFPGAPIEIVDSLSTAMAMGFQVLSVARLAQQGASLAECKALAEKAMGYRVWSLDTLNSCIGSGRIGGGTRFLGSALNIKPILNYAMGTWKLWSARHTQEVTCVVKWWEAHRRSNVRLAALHPTPA